MTRSNPPAAVYLRSLAASSRLCSSCVTSLRSSAPTVSSSAHSLPTQAPEDRPKSGTPKVSVGRFCSLRSCREGVTVGILFLVGCEMDEPARCAGRPCQPVGVTGTCRPDVRKRPRKPSVPRRRFTVDCRCADHNPRGEVPTGRGGVAAAAARPPGQALACPCCPHAPGPEARGQGMGPDDASREAFAKDQRVPLTGRGPGAGSGAAGETPPRR